MKSSDSSLELPCGPDALTTRYPLYPLKLTLKFADHWLSMSRYSLLAELKPRCLLYCLFLICFKSVCLLATKVIYLPVMYEDFLTVRVYKPNALVALNSMLSLHRPESLSRFLPVEFIASCYCVSDLRTDDVVLCY
jgi:hypothetical protein